MSEEPEVESLEKSTSGSFDDVVSISPALATATSLTW